MQLVPLHLVNHCIWPYESGEVIVQCYNTLLTLAALLEVSDGVTIVQNEHLHTACKSLLGVGLCTLESS
jgi:tubulin delta